MDSRCRVIPDVPPLAVAAQIALDLHLLRAVGTAALPPLARIWDCTDEAVVIGVAQKAAEVVCLDACRSDGMQVLPRFSGGGTVLICRGCVCWSVIVPLDGAVKPRDVQGAYRHVLDPVMAGFATRGLRVTFEPPSDLALDGRKIAGTAQAQKHGAVLVHGSILVETDPDRIARYLPEPREAPEYRAGRSHHAFLHNLGSNGLDCAAVAALLRAAWTPGGETVAVPPWCYGLPVPLTLHATGRSQ
jgi:lipoate-protein ligase A